MTVTVMLTLQRERKFYDVERVDTPGGHLQLTAKSVVLKQYFPDEWLSFSATKEPV